MAAIGSGGREAFTTSAWQTQVPDNFNVLGRFLAPEELVRMRVICKAWRACLPDNSPLWTWHAERVGAFGRTAWKQYTGLDPGPTRPLPPEIHALLNAPCPFWPAEEGLGKLRLYWIPSQVTRTVDGRTETITLKTLGADLIPGCRYDYFSDIAQEAFGDAPVAGHWILVTPNVIPGSRRQSYAAQQALVGARGYQVPEAVEAVLMVFLEHKRSGTYPLGQDPWTYTRCSESTRAGHLVVGGFAARGLGAYDDYNDYDDEGSGVVALQRF